MRPVLRLSPLAKVGATVVLVGFALALWADRSETAWAVRVSRGLLIAGLVIYIVARVRMVRGRRGQRSP